MLHREPTEVAVSRIGMDAEAQLFDIELEGFVLIANVQPDYSDTLTHNNSGLLGAPFLPACSRRRFSETAVVMSGR